MYEELIAKLRGAKKFFPGYLLTMKDFRYELMPQDLCEAADAIEDLITALTASNEVIAKSKPKWIPVTERLPEERGDYLVVINCPRGRWDEICAFDGEKEWVSIDEYAEIATKWVTHWMPLPEPPKEEV